MVEENESKQFSSVKRYLERAYNTGSDMKFSNLDVERDMFNQQNYHTCNYLLKM